MATVGASSRMCRPGRSIRRFAARARSTPDALSMIPRVTQPIGHGLDVGHGESDCHYRLDARFRTLIPISNVRSRRDQVCALHLSQYAVRCTPNPTQIGQGVGTGQQPYRWQPQPEGKKTSAWKVLGVLAAVVVVMAAIGVIIRASSDDASSDPDNATAARGAERCTDRHRSRLRGPQPRHGRTDYRRTPRSGRARARPGRRGDPHGRRHRLHLHRRQRLPRRWSPRPLGRRVDHAGFAALGFSSDADVS